ncbi:MAG: endonuclease MutS2 [candidate division WOR-3 bacterium]
MDKETLNALDFPRLKEILVNFCTTELGREKAQQLMPNLTPAEAKLELDRLEEVLELNQEPPLSGIVDIRTLITQARVGRVLTPGELLKVYATCTGLRASEEFFRRYKKDQRALRGKKEPTANGRQPNEESDLGSLVNDIVSFPELEQEIKRVIDESGMVRDTASPRLAEVRSELKERRNQLVAQLERMIETNPDWFEGPVMVRRERFVLPVKLPEKNRVPGVVHSVSDTGQTVFIEPLTTIPEQNRLQELRDAEKEEINRLLRDLSAKVATFETELSRALDRVAALDLLIAKRRLAIKFNCHKPIITDEGKIELVQARHPLLLLHKQEVVPLDLRFPDGVNVVIVSGPNAGGKTVVLKTLGLCSLLLKAGMFVPAASGTKLPFFEKIFADIGDEQSLEADMSSFTAHLKRLKEILLEADGRSLVLIDEIGAATAPEEGAALAIAVLEELRNRQISTVATTHFNTLKLFARNEPGMVNAAMEFQNRPTYRLIMGVPGESSAFEIAESLGFPAQLLARAKMRLGKEWLDLSAKLRTLDKKLQEVEKERGELRTERSRVEQLAKEYQTKLGEFEIWRKEQMAHLHEEEERFLKETRRQVENLIRELREEKANHKSIVRAKRYIEERLSQLSKEPISQQPAMTGESLAIGDVVESRLFHRQGQIIELKGNRAVVAFGNIKTELDIRDLNPAVSPQPTANRGQPNEEQYEFIPRLNVRGMTKEDAVNALNRFLEEATIARVNELSILHGKGTGALRSIIWRRLKQDKRVMEVRFAEPAEGGMGVTLVRLRLSSND